jgi:hypothetical protein
MQLPADLPAGLVGGDDGGVVDLGEEGVVGGGEGMRDALEREIQAAGADRQREAAAQDEAQFAEGHPDPLVEVGGKGECAGTDRDARGTQSVTRLEGVASAHGLLASHAATDADVEAPHERRGWPDVFLVLGDDAFEFNVAAAVGAARLGPHLVRLVDVVGDGAPRLDAVVFAALAPRAFGIRLRKPLREGSGLTLARPLHVRELFSQARLVPLEGLDPVPKSLDLVCLSFAPRQQLLARPTLGSGD